MPLYRASHWPHGELDIQTTQTEGTSLVLRNETAALVGTTQQYSPSVQLDGAAWKSNATAESQAASWRIENQPQTGAAAITSVLHFLSSIDGGGYASKLNLTSAGVLTSAGAFSTASGNITSAGTIRVAGSSNYGMGVADFANGLGTTMWVVNAANQELGLINSGRADGANNVVHYVDYIPGATSVTNAATMRNLSLGWTSSTGPTYNETAAVMVDGVFINNNALKSVLAESATGVLAHHYGTGTAGTASAAAAVTAGLQTQMIVETLSPSAIETSMTTAIPAGCTILAVICNCESALTGGGTTVTWSIGTAADPDKYGTAGYPAAVGDALTQNSKSNWTGAVQTGTSTEQIVLTGAATGGAADGDTALTVGSVKVMVIYNEPDAIPDAA